ncbi:hypothetical protein QTP88_004615 [Uroleucon formosanum]
MEIPSSQPQINNEIDMKTLLLLTEDMIKELVPVIGHRHNPFDIKPRDNIGSILLELTQTDTSNSKDYQHIPFTSVELIDVLQSANKGKALLATYQKKRIIGQHRP